MKTSQTIYLGVTLFLAIQFISAHVIRDGPACCGLGPGSDVCGCNEVVVKPVRPAKSAYYASPGIINEAAAARLAAAGPGGCDASRAEVRDLEGGLGLQDLLSLSPSSRVVPRFKPIGDLCSLADARSPTGVTPAYPGKPKCSICNGGAGSSIGNGQGSQYSSGGAGSAFGQQGAISQGFRSLGSIYNNLNAFDDENDGISFDEQENIYNSNIVPVLPADAVSLSLAYGLAQRVANFVPEEKLSFGPRTLPADGRIETIIPDIPEERLLSVDKPVVELKTIPRSKGSCSSLIDELEQEALERQRLELEADVDAQQGSGALITYSDLGYAPVSPSSNTFVNTVSGDSGPPGFPGDSNAACGPLGPPVPGYRSGHLIVRDEVKNFDDDTIASSIEQDTSYSAEDGDDAEECRGGILARLRSYVHKGHYHDGSCGCQ